MCVYIYIYYIYIYIYIYGTFFSVCEQGNINPDWKNAEEDQNIRKVLACVSSLFKD